jgi:hypothetical protein
VLRIGDREALPRRRAEVIEERLAEFRLVGLPFADPFAQNLLETGDPVIELYEVAGGLSLLPEQPPEPCELRTEMVPLQLELAGHDRHGVGGDAGVEPMHALELGQKLLLEEAMNRPQ